MKIENRTKEQLLEEANKLKDKIAELEKSGIGHTQVKNALKDSEERFRKLSESAFEGIVITDKGKVRDVNKQLAEMLKIKLDKLIGMNVFDFVAPESRKIVEEHIRLGSEEPYEHFAQRNDGSIFPVEVRAKSLPFGGEILRVTAIRDITERKHAEEALKDSEKRLNILFDFAPDAIFLVDNKGTFVDGNKAAEELMGYKKEELIGKSFLKLKLLSAKDLIKATKSLMKSVQRKSTGPDEYNLIRKDGSQIPVEIRTHPIKINNKKINLGIARDITERKQAEEKLIKTQNFLRETEKSGKIGGWEVNLETMTHTWTEETYRIHEVDLDYKLDMSKSLRFYAPWARPLIEQAVNHTIKTGEPFDLELELNTAKGKKIWIHALGKAWMEGGVTKRLSGSFQEITERKQAEEKLISRNKELETWAEVTGSREIFMLDLKKEINELLEKSGKKPKYKIPV